MKTKQAEPGGCIEWTAATNSQGYGIFGLTARRHFPAHRYAYQLALGRIAEGHQIHHICGNPGCMNPDHLESLLPKDLMKATPAHCGNRTHCAKGHPYDAQNTRWYRGKRVCRTCKGWRGNAKIEMQSTVKQKRSKPARPKRARLKPQFWDKVAILGIDECWPWQGTFFASGYGRFFIDGRSVRAHRMARELFLGPLSKGILACHSCDNKACCNPYHIFEGTHADNHRDRNLKERQAKGSRNGRAVLTEKTALAARERLLHGEDKRAVAEAFGVSRSTIGKLWRGERWTTPFEGCDEPG